MNARRNVFVFAGPILAVSLSLPCWAAGTVFGVVEDRQGNPKQGVEVTLSPISDDSLRTYSQKTNAKGNYVFLADNGDYQITPRLAGFGLDRMAIHVTDAKRKPKYDWSGRILPGQKPAQLGVSTEYKIQVNLVIAEQAALDQEYSKILLGTIGKALEDGDRDKARKTIDSLMAKSPDDPMGLTLRAYLETDEGKMVEAEADLKQAVQKDPALVDAWYQLATLYVKTNRPADAAEAFRKTAAVATDDDMKGKAWLGVGEIERDAGHREKAIEAFEKAYDILPPQQAVIASEVGALYTALGNTPMAENWMGKAQAGGQTDPLVLYNIAVQHFNKKELGPAIDGFKKVIAAKPDFAEAYRNLGFAFLNSGDVGGAKVHLEKYLELQPKASDAADIAALLQSLEHR